MQHIWSTLKGCETMYTNNEYIALVQKRFATIRVDGSELTYYPEIRATVWKVAFLPNDLLLVEGGTDAKYHLISLRDGKILKSCKIPGRRCLRSRHFAVSPDGSIAFDYWNIKNQTFLIRIDLQQLSYESFPIDPYLRMLADIVYVSPQEVLLLQTQSDTVNGAAHMANCVVSVKITDSGNLPVCYYKWRCAPSRRPFATDGRYVLNLDLTIRDLQTESVRSLLAKKPVGFTDIRQFVKRRYYPKEQMLQLADGTKNVFIGFAEQKMIARYNTDKIGLFGCVIGDTFLIGTSEGIITKPFPMIETSTE